MSAATGITIEKGAAMSSLRGHGAALDTMDLAAEDECEMEDDMGVKRKMKKVAFSKEEVARRDRETTESYMKYAVGSVAATVQKNCAKQGIFGGKKKK